MQGFYFARMQYSPIQTFTARFTASMNYTAHATKRRTGLYRGFSCGCTHSTAHDTKPTQAAIIPPATRWRAYQRPDALNRYPRYHRHARTLHRPAQPPIIIRYIRARGAPVVDPYKTVQHIADHASGGGVSMLSTPGGLQSGTGSAGRPDVLAPYTRRNTPAARGTAGGAEPLAAFAASLFGLSPDSQ